MRTVFFDFLHPEEEVLGLVRSNFGSEWRRVLLGSVWVLLPFFFFFPLLTLGLFGLVFFFLLASSGIWHVVRSLKMWRNSFFLITDKRVIDVDQVGFFKQEVADVEHQNIRDVKIIRKRLSPFGTIRVKTVKSVGYELEISGIRNPENVANLIHEVQYITAQGSEKTFHAANIK